VSGFFTDIFATTHEKDERAALSHLRRGPFPELAYARCATCMEALRHASPMPEHECREVLFPEAVEVWDPTR